MVVFSFIFILLNAARRAMGSNSAAAEAAAALLLTYILILPQTGIAGSPWVSRVRRLIANER